ncbi:hypothetical protein NA57DRAFT_70166 [Rhizodiscina lignyota]|uniref:Exosome complex protein n=1 Tax=Rhizodiscina lignyota TaxID=1504668 RepID=A0A9P4IQK2_9PEZI|nr:hypothetical protein NA57DRAFT_70166 [Rhizodiscina lignyota]
MDQADLRPAIDELSSDISALMKALSPLLNAPLSTISSKLPLLDKAKLHVLITYAIESLLFSSLRLSGVDAKQHPVFKELVRVRQYFEKVKKAEEGPEKREQVLDKAAAGRFIRHALSGNEKLDRERAEGSARSVSEAMKQVPKPSGGGVPLPLDGASSSGYALSHSNTPAAAKKRKRSEGELEESSGNQSMPSDSKRLKKQAREEKRQAKRQAKEKEKDLAGLDDDVNEGPAAPEPAPEPELTRKQQKKQAAKQAKKQRKEEKKKKLAAQKEPKSP